MSYQRKPTVLVARQGYSGLSGPEACGPNQQWDPNFVIAGLPPGQCTPKGSAMTPPPSGGGVLSTIGSFLGGLFKPSTPTAPVIIAPQSSTPDWLLPVAIGGVGLVAVLLITKQRSNPARRRRHRR